MGHLGLVFRCGSGRNTEGEKRSLVLGATRARQKRPRIIRDTWYQVLGNGLKIASYIVRDGNCGALETPKQISNFEAPPTTTTKALMFAREFQLLHLLLFLLLRLLLASVAAASAAAVAVTAAVTAADIAACLNHHTVKPSPYSSNLVS